MTRKSLSLSLICRSLLGLLVALSGAITQAAVGRIAGDFAVDSAGAATYRIPIAVAEAANGMRPSIALTYNSRSRDGLAGVGWNLTGFSAISRCGLTIALDTRRQGVTYTDEDRFCLDGQPLIKISTGAYGGNGVEYRTEIHDYQKVTSHEAVGTGPKYFKVRLRNGLTHYYGESASSRAEAPNTGEVRVWALTRTVDHFSNEIVFEFNERANGEYDPQKISWGQGNYALEFTYAPRPDVRTGYVDGSPWARTRRLTNIRYNFQGNTVHDYKLAYGAPAPGTGRSRLASVTQCAGADCLPATTITWQDGETGWGNPVPGQLGGGEVFLDYDGDGDMDRVFVTVSDPDIYLSIVSNGVYGVGQDTGLQHLKTPCLGCDIQPVPLEFDGDGLTDLLVVADDDKYHVYISNADSHDPSCGLFCDYNTQLDREATARLGSGAFDMDGDGLDDLVYVRDAVPLGEGRVRFRKNDGAQFGTEIDTGLLHGSGSQGGAYSWVFNRNVPQPDFDGDGRKDLLLRAAFQIGPIGFGVYYDIYLSTGDNFSTTLYGSTADFTFDSNVPFQTPDINGDGLADVVFQNDDNGGKWSTMISDGTGFKAPVHSSIAVISPYRGVIADYDNDGRDDLLQDGKVYLSDGNTYSDTNFAVISFHNCFCAVVVDVDGDGYLDVVESGDVHLHKGPRADLVTDITDGLGNYHQPSYGPLSATPAYSANGTTGIDQPITAGGVIIVGAAPNPPMTRLVRGGARYVVETTRENDGIGNAFTTSYQYWNAQRDMQGRGFLGFAQIKTADSRRPGDITTIFRQDFPYVGRMQFRRTLRDMVGPREELLNWSTFSQTGLEPLLSPAYYFVRRGSSKDISYEQDNSTLIRHEVHFYTWNDDHGVVSKEEAYVLTDTWHSSNDAFYTKRQVSGFDESLKTSQWCLGRAAQVDVTKIFPDAQPTIETRTTLSAYDPGTCAVTEERVGSTTDPAEQAKTTYGIDAQGRPFTITRNDGNDSLPARTTQFSYPNTWTSRATSESFLIDDQTNPVVSRAWDEALGLIATLTNVQGLTTNWTYDGFGRLSREAQTTLGTFADYFYTGSCGFDGCPASSQYNITSVGSDGSLSITSHDRFGRRVAETRRLKHDFSMQAFVYDAFGHLSKETVPYIPGEPVHWIHYGYDALDRRIMECHPVDEGDTSCLSVTEWNYSAENVYKTDAEAHSTRYMTRPDGKLHQVIEVVASGANGATSYRYTPFGELASVTDPDGTAPTMTMTYDALGYPKSRTEVDTGTWTYAYNVFGELTSQQDDQGHVVTLSYDQLGRVTTRSEDEGTSTWSYIQSGNGFGSLETVTGPTDQPANGYIKQHTYNALAQLTRTVTTIASQSYYTDYGYNGHGQMESMTYPTTIGYRPRFVYGYVNGYLDTVRQDNGAGATELIYQVMETDALGRELNSVSGGGFIERRSTYDRGNTRLTGLSTTVYLQSGATSIQDYTYQWDRVGNLRQRHDNNNGLTETFEYDDLNRLTETRLNGQRTQLLTYYPDGRIDSKTGNSGDLGVGVYAYGNGMDSNAVTGITGDRTNSYHYDGNGNMDCRGDTTAACGQGDPITWYSFNKPASIQYTNGAHIDYSAFVYGPDRRRIRQTSKRGVAIRNIRYVDRHFEEETAGNATRYRSFVFANGRAVYALHERRSTTSCGLTTFASNSYFIHRDHQGSVDQVTLWNISGTGPVASSYDAFGKRRNADWTPDDDDSHLNVNHVSKRGYTGHEHLDNVRLIHMNGRVQDPIIGRMISADPLIGDLMNPQTLNQYSYVANNPVSFIDPTGFYFAGCDSAPSDCVPVTGWRFTIATEISFETSQALIQKLFYSDFGTVTVDFGYDSSVSAHEIGLVNQFAAAQERCGPSCTVSPGQHVAKAIGKYNAAISAAEATTLGKFQAEAEFQQELRGTLSDVAFKLSIANDRSHLMFDPADAGKPLGSVIKRTGFLERLFTGRKFRHSYPNRLVPVGLEVSSGFSGAQRDIRNAVGVVVGYPHVYPGVLNADLLLSNQRLADYVGATVYAFTTRGGFNGPFAINPDQ